MSSKNILLAAMAIFLALTFIDETGVAITLPSVQAEFGLSAVGLQWVLNAFFLSLAICVLPAGHAADRVGYRRVFLIGMMIFVTASIGCTIAASGNILIGARFIQGVGAAMMLSTYTLLIARVYPPNEQGAALGTSASIGAFFLASGPFIGGFIAETIDWRWIYLINVPVGIIVAYMIIKSVPRDPEAMQAPRLKVGSVVTFSVGFSALIVALMQATDWGWTSWRTELCLVVAAFALAYFFILQRTSTRMIDLSLFRIPAFAAANFVLLTSQISVMCVAFWALWTQIALGMTPIMAGLALLPAGVPILLMGRIAGIWADRSGPRAPIQAGTIILMVSMLTFAITSHFQNYYLVAIAMTLYAFGAPLTISPAIKSVLINAPSSQQGEAAGILNTMRQLGAALAIGVIGAVLNHFDRLNTAIVVKAHPELSGKAIQEAQDILIKQPEILNHLPRVAGLLVRQALSVGYAEAMGYAMLVAGLFAFVGCLVAFSVSTDSNLH